MLKVGEYFRTPYGVIGKITNIPKHNKYQDDGFCLNNKFIVCGREAMKQLKSTPNIIDLIKEGDLVNNHIVKQTIYNFASIDKIAYLDLEGFNKLVCNDDIKSIVTKEQFESMQYEVK